MSLSYQLRQLPYKYSRRFEKLKINLLHDINAMYGNSYRKIKKRSENV